jgi:molybdate transport system substrate-binding protein
MLGWSTLDVVPIEARGARAAWTWTALVVGIVAAVAWPAQPPDVSVNVAAAADLAGAFQEMGAAFEAKTGKKVAVTFASTGQLADDIARGAAYDVFAAASEQAVDDVVRAGACDPRTRALYARGRLAVWTRGAARLAPVSLADLSSPKLARIAVPDPALSPYGRAARQAAATLGVWPAVRPRAVYGKDALETLELARRGLADVALVPLSLARTAAGGSFVAVDEALHSPIRQALVACSRGRSAEGGRQFAAFVRSEQGRAILERFGFALPDGA